MINEDRYVGRRRPRWATVLMVAVLLIAGSVKGYGQERGFARGADVSWCTEMEADGRVFRRADGAERELFALLKEIGMTAVRLRVWVNPEGFGYGAWSDKADVLEKARRAHAQGLDVMIDFHYSDFFADPGTQTMPKDWQDYTPEAQKTALKEHTVDVLEALRDAGIAPRWVQVGNETNSGMMWDTGRIDWNKSGSARYTNYVALSNVGYDAVKSVFPDAIVIIHLGGTENGRWFFTDFKAAGGKFDMIGLSHYPTASEWDSSSSAATHSNVNAAKCVSEAIDALGVPVMICETGFESWQPELAAEVMHDLMKRMKSIAQCAGVFYWEPEDDGRWKPAYYQKLGWGAYGKGAFTTDGRPTAALDAFADDVSGISRPTTSYPVQPTAVYNLQGCRLTKPAKGLSIIVGEASKLYSSLK